MTATTWMSRAACRPHVDQGNDWWHGHAEQRELAARICARCPVQPQCLDYALDQSLYGGGIIAGMTSRELSTEARRRGLTRHGTSSGYQADGCRCDLCVAYMSEVYRASRSRRQAVS